MHTMLTIKENPKWFSKSKRMCLVPLRYFDLAGYDIDWRERGKENNPHNLILIIIEVVIKKKTIYIR